MKRLEEDSAIGAPFLSCNAGRQDLLDVVALVRDLNKQAEVQTKLVADYLCVISYQRMQLEKTIPTTPDYRAAYLIKTSNFIVKRGLERLKT